MIFLAANALTGLSRLSDRVGIMGAAFATGGGSLKTQPVSQGTNSLLLMRHVTFLDVKVNHIIICEPFSSYMCSIYYHTCDNKAKTCQKRTQEYAVESSSTAFEPKLSPKTVRTSKRTSNLRASRSN